MQARHWAAGDRGAEPCVPDAVYLMDGWVMLGCVWWLLQVYTALTIRLNRLIKTVSLAQPDGGSASSLFKVLTHPPLDMEHCPPPLLTHTGSLTTAVACLVGGWVWWWCSGCARRCRVR